MTKLTDTQKMLLAAAARREDGGLLPLPPELKPSGGIIKSLTVLLGRGLAEERETTDAQAAYRTNGDQHVALFLTPVGRRAISSETGEATAPTAVDEDAAEHLAAEGMGDRGSQPTKASMVLELLRRAEGAALDELMEVTGWLPHTCRAALTGLRKKGHDIQRTKLNGASRYRVEGKPPGSA